MRDMYDAGDGAYVNDLSDAYGGKEESEANDVNGTGDLRNVRSSL